MMEKIKKEAIKKEVKKNIVIIIASFFIFVIIMFAFVFQKFKIISFLSCIIILFVGIENHASVQDRCFAMTICFILALGFMFL